MKIFEKKLYDNNKATRMGGTSSKVTSEVTNKAITNFVMSLGKECSAGASNNIIFDFENVGGDYIFQGNTIEQKATVNFQCIQDSMSAAQIHDKMSTFLSQQSKTEGNPLSLPWGGVSSEESVKLYNEVTKDLKMEDIQKCALAAQDTFVKRGTNIGGNVVIKDNTITQVSEVIGKCNQISQMSADLATAINNKIDQKSDTSMPSWLEGLFGDFGGIMIAAGVALCCCCCLLIIGSILAFIFLNPSSKQPHAVLTENVGLAAGGTDAGALRAGDM